MSFLLALAVAFTLGTEAPVDPQTTVIPAHGHQAQPDVASNGHDFFAVWFDGRGTDVTLRGTRLHGEHPLEPYGIELGKGQSPRIASDGDAYLFAYMSFPSVYAARIEEGRVLPRTKIATGLLDDLVSDGTTYCALVQTVTGRAAVFVDPHGALLATVALPAAEDHEILPRPGGGYTVVMAGNGGISLLPVTAAGAGTVRRVANVPGIKDVEAIAGGNHILLAWYPDSRLAWLVLDASGNAIGAPALLRYDFIATPVLAWDGREFLIARDNGYDVSALRVGTDGLLGNSVPLRLAGRTWGFAFGFDGSRALLVTTEDPRNVDVDVRARRIESFASLGEQPGAVIAFSGEAQSMQAATAADGTLLTIGEDLRGILHRPDGTKRRIDLRTGGSRLSDVGAAGDVFLVVAGGVRGHVAWRVRSDGAVLSSEPIALPFGAQADAATDRRDFFLVWPEPNGVYGQHLTATGAQPRFAIAAPRNYVVGDVHAAWTGTAYVVVWGEGVNGQMYARVPAGPQTLAVRKSDGPRGLAIGSNGNGALAVWVDEYCIMASSLSREGIPQGAPRRVRCGVPLGYDTRFGIVWDGAAYTIVWSVDDSLPRVMAVRVLADGTPVSEVETVAPGGQGPVDVSLLPDGRLALVYHRVVREAPYFGVPRAFFRTLELQGNRRRMRSARP